MAGGSSTLLFNLLSPNIHMHILLTVLYIFLMLLVGRNWLNINTFHVWWSFPLFAWPVYLTNKWYCKEKLDTCHSWGPPPPSWGGGLSGVVVGTLDFRSEGQWFKAQSPPSCCFLRQETLPHIVSLHQGVLMGTSDIHVLLGVTQWWTSIPSGGSSHSLSSIMLQKLG